MNSQNLKRHKCGEKRYSRPKTKNDEPEIYVLPPHLLQQLGINLGSFVTAQQSPKDLPVTPEQSTVDTSSPEIPGQSRPDKVSSILEDANLMKKSVLLSPIFNSTSELEIANTVNEKHVVDRVLSMATQSGPVDDVKCPSGALDDKADQVPMICDLQTNKSGGSNSHECKNIDPSHKSDIHVENLNESGSFIDHISENVILEEITIEANCVNNGDHPDGAYASNSSNSNPGIVENRDKLVHIPGMHFFDSQPYTESSNKIDKLSEEILNTTQLKAVQSLNTSQTVDLIPITINTVIPTNNPKEHLNSKIDGTAMQFSLRNEDVTFDLIKDTLSAEPYGSSEQAVNSEGILIYDDKGNVIQIADDNIKTNINHEVTLHFVATGGQDNLLNGDCNMVSDKHLLIDNYSLDLSTSQNAHQKKVTISEGEGSDNNFAASLDFVVSEIEKNFEESEEMLEKFASQITSNDADDILRRIECSSEKELCQMSSNNNLLTVTDSNLQSSQTVCNSIIQKDQTNTILEKNEFMGNLVVKTSNTASNCLKYSSKTFEEKNVTVRKLTAHEVKELVSKNKLNGPPTNIYDPKDKGAQTKHHHNIIKQETTHIELMERKYCPPSDPVKQLVNENFRLPKGKEKSKVRVYSNPKKSNVNHSQKNITKSKLCIQGVEKPGGTNNEGQNEKQIKVFRTYNRNNRLKISRASILDTLKLENQVKYNANEKFLMSINQPMTATNCTTANFCVCGDFGRFSFYNYDDSMYEHLHFWEHKDIGTNVEDVFSIYHNCDMDFNNKFGPDRIDHKIEYFDSKLSVCSICWNNIEDNNIEEDMCKYVNNISVNSEESSLSTSEVCVPKPVNFTTEQNIVETIRHHENTKHDGTILPANETTCISKSPNDSFKLEIEQIKIESKEAKPTKRKASAEHIDENEPQNKKTLKCGVCNNLLVEEEWDDHVVKEHCNIAWKAGESIDLNNPELALKIKQTLKNDGSLKCIVCNLEIQNDKIFIIHIKKCLRKKDMGELSNSEVTDEEDLPLSAIDIKRSKCGVCHQEVKDLNWNEHIAREHNYMAWKDGEPPLDLEDEVQVCRHLTDTARQLGGLICSKCGLRRKYGKAFLQHIRSCDGNQEVTPSTSTKSGVSAEEVEASQCSDHLAEKQEHLACKDGGHPLDLCERSNSQVTDEEDAKRSKCGVCHQEVQVINWNEHVAKEHNYIAWRDGESPLDLEDEIQVCRHLTDTARQLGGLICSKCGLRRKYGKAFLQHIRSCDGNQVSDNDSNVNDTANSSFMSQSIDASNTTDESGADQVIVKCGVCKEEVKSDEWILHIQKAHDYLGWREGETLDLEDEEVIRQHLHNIVKQVGGLTCSKCGLIRKYPKVFMQHIKHCVESNKDSNANDTANSTCMSEFEASALNANEADETLVKCGVCKEQVKTCNWMNHIQSAHDYLAWREGETLNLDDAREVYEYLNHISKSIDGLVCSKCGIKKKYVKNFLDHIKNCESKPFTFIQGELKPAEEGKYRCSVCSKQFSFDDWQEHKMEEHYNIAWAVGEKPIDITNANVVIRYLKEYKYHHKKLICNICKTSRESLLGFYAHVLSCGKTEEEINKHKAVCDICSKSYFYIYRLQHMAGHKEQEYIKERDLKLKEEKAEIECPSGRRRAAQKAKMVIEEYKSKAGQYKYNCSSCSFGTDERVELKRHDCGDNLDHLSDSETSVSLDEEEFDDESIKSNVDSDLSDAEETQFLKKSHKAHASAADKISRLPFTVNNQDEYLLKTVDEFYKTNYFDETLYSEWRSCECVPVPEDELSKYLPPLEESCKIQFCDDDWVIFRRFEAKQQNGLVMFVGASIQTISWVPARVDGDGSNYLSVACHLDADCPRLESDDTSKHAALIQIWDYGDFKVLPKLVFGLALDYGTVWALDWCPSGARDSILSSEATDKPRLGLLAVACSDGTAYIFSVPDPTTIAKSENLFYKLKPVAELRLSNVAREKIYQATSLKWSTQKGHALIVVGYSDGTTAYYDLDNLSPLTRVVQDGITILYPYYDERPHAACVTGVDIFPSSESSIGDAVCSSASRGACVVSRPAVRPTRVHSNMAAASAIFQPHWPSVIMAGDDVVTSMAHNELEMWGGGQRFGPARVCVGCVRCARLALFAPPVLRYARPHPVYTKYRKKILGTIDMVPLGKKRKLAEDELTVKIEPTKYEEAVKKYGIKVVIDKNIQLQLNKPREQFPERFPLADVPSMAFCSTARHHSRLAVATHTGFVIIFIV